MQTRERLERLRGRKPLIDELVKYGFALKDGVYLFVTEIMDGAFEARFYADPGGALRFKVIDSASGDEYTLVHCEEATGAFVGAVRAECEKRFADIVNRCFAVDIFKSAQAQGVIDYIRQRYGVEAEFLWKKFPNNAVFREGKTKKWFAALLTVDKQKVGLVGKGTIEILDLREHPENLAALIDNERYLPGYHMNKKHWYTLRLDGTLSASELYARIDVSFSTLGK